MAAETAPPGRFGATARRDRWWLAPLLTAAGLTAFGIYSVVVVAMGTDYLYAGGGALYLSPFYSPDLESWGLHLPFTYAVFVIWVPLGFRLTCYYYRKAYYRAYFLAPPACTVASARRRRYRGEAALPYILLNAHRYFFYLATLVLGFLGYDAVRAFFFRGSDGSLHVGVGVGLAVHVRLQLASPPGRRQPRLFHVLCGLADAAPAVAPRDLSERPAHAMGLDQPGRRRPDRPLHSARVGGCLPRPEASLNGCRAA